MSEDNEEIPMTSLKEPLDEIEVRQKELNAERRRITDMFGLTAADLKLTAATPTRTRVQRSAKYREPETGKTRTGKGLKPKWVTAALARGQTKEDLVIRPSE